LKSPPAATAGDTDFLLRRRTQLKIAIADRPKRNSPLQFQLELAHVVLQARTHTSFLKENQMRTTRIPLLVLGLLALAAPICAQSVTAKSTYVGEAKASAGAVTDEMAEMFIATEKSVWAALQKHDMATFGSFLPEDHIYVGGGGTFSKAESMQMLAKIPMGNYTLDQFQVLMIDKDAAIVTYRASFKSVSGNQESASSKQSSINVDVGAQRANAASAASPASAASGGGQDAMTHERNTTVWVKRNGKWLALLHQETTQQAH
jgi:hypothetical protein